MDEEKKSFMENAKGFLSSWKDDYANKNKDILERKKKRDAEAEEMKKQMQETFEEVKTDLEGKAKDIAVVVSHELAEFSEALKKGTAELHQKLELEKHLDQLGFFLKNAGSAASEKFKQITEEVKQKVNKFETDDEMNKEVQNIKDSADKTKNTEKNIDDLTDEANKLFNDLENKTE